MAKKNGTGSMLETTSKLWTKGEQPTDTELNDRLIKHVDDSGYFLHFKKVWKIKDYKKIPQGTALWIKANADDAGDERDFSIGNVSATGTAGSQEWRIIPADKSRYTPPKKKPKESTTAPVAAQTIAPAVAAAAPVAAQTIAPAVAAAAPVAAQTIAPTVAVAAPVAAQTIAPAEAAASPAAEKAGRKTAGRKPKPATKPDDTKPKAVQTQKGGRGRKQVEKAAAPADQPVAQTAAPAQPVTPPQEETKMPAGQPVEQPVPPVIHTVQEPAVAEVKAADSATAPINAEATSVEGAPGEVPSVEEARSRPHDKAVSGGDAVAANAEAAHVADGVTDTSAHSDGEYRWHIGYRILDEPGHGHIESWKHGSDAFEINYLRGTATRMNQRAVGPFRVKGPADPYEFLEQATDVNAKLSYEHGDLYWATVNTEEEVSAFPYRGERMIRTAQRKADILAVVGPFESDSLSGARTLATAILMPTAEERLSFESVKGGLWNPTAVLVYQDGKFWRAAPRDSSIPQQSKRFYRDAHSFRFLQAQEIGDELSVDAAGLPYWVSPIRISKDWARQIGLDIDLLCGKNGAMISDAEDDSPASAVDTQVGTVQNEAGANNPEVLVPENPLAGIEQLLQNAADTDTLDEEMEPVQLEPDWTDWTPRNVPVLQSDTCAKVLFPVYAGGETAEDAKQLVKTLLKDAGFLVSTPSGIDARQFRYGIKGIAREEMKLQGLWRVNVGWWFPTPDDQAQATAAMDAIMDAFSNSQVYHNLSIADGVIFGQEFIPTLERLKPKAQEPEPPAQQAPREPVQNDPPPEQAESTPPVTRLFVPVAGAVEFDDDLSFMYDGTMWKLIDYVRQQHLQKAGHQYVPDGYSDKTKLALMLAEYGPDGRPTGQHIAAETIWEAPQPKEPLWKRAWYAFQDRRATAAKLQANVQEQVANHISFAEVKGVLKNAWTRIAHAAKVGRPFIRDLTAQQRQVLVSNLRRFDIQTVWDVNPSDKTYSLSVTDPKTEWAAKHLAQAPSNTLVMIHNGGQTYENCLHTLEYLEKARFEKANPREVLMRPITEGENKGLWALYCKGNERVASADREEIRRVLHIR